jgi:N-acetylmuramoyl-L-alanine amidase
MRNLTIAALFTAFLCGCVAHPRTLESRARRGDEIVVCGQLVHTGTRIILWNDTGGFNAYASPAGVKWNARSNALAQGATLPLLQQTVDQFVIHYDVCGSSRECFRVLQARNLSVHFMLDLDGTIYQALDVKERAWHATTSNTRSIGIEIANIGAYQNPDDPALVKWRTSHGLTRGATRGVVQGKMLYQYDLTPQQYDALIKLTAALCRTFPQIKCDYPRTNQKLPDEQLRSYHGVLGHYHVQSNKEDPGPAFQWDRVIQGARRMLRSTGAQAQLTG